MTSPVRIPPISQLTMSIPCGHPWFDWVSQQHAKKGKVDRRHATLTVTLGGIDQCYEMIAAENDRQRALPAYRTTWRMVP